MLCWPLKQDFDKIYQRLNVTLTERGESFYNPMLPGVVADLIDRGIAEDSNGATCIFIKVPIDLLAHAESRPGQMWISAATKPVPAVPGVECGLGQRLLACGSFTCEQRC